MSSEDTPHIFHEKQEGNLCAQHALNALLQGQYFTAVDLAEIARELDEQEHAALGGAPAGAKSHNMDDSGYFSIQVITAALLRFGQLELLNWNHNSMQHVRARPESAVAFICNQREHWFCIRRFGDKWFNLNSMQPRPVHINVTYLGMLLAQLQNDGYSIFVVNGTLPVSDADRAADKIDTRAYEDQGKSGAKKPAAKPGVVAFSGSGYKLVDDPAEAAAAAGVDANEDPELAAAIALSLQQQGTSTASDVPPPSPTEDKQLNDALLLSQKELDNDDHTLQAILRQTAEEAGVGVEDTDDRLMQRALAESLNAVAAQDAAVPSGSSAGGAVSPGQQQPSAEELRNRRAAFLDKFSNPS